MGSVMSYSLGLGPDRPAPAGIMAFSGFIPTVDGWQPDLQRDTRAFIAHGRRDPVMDVQFARTASELLTAGGLDVTYLESDAAHHIDPAHVPAAAKWLRATSDRTLTGYIRADAPRCSPSPPSCSCRRRRRPRARR